MEPTDHRSYLQLLLRTQFDPASADSEPCYVRVRRVGVVIVVGREEGSMSSLTLSDLPPPTHPPIHRCAPFSRPQMLGSDGCMSLRTIKMTPITVADGKRGVMVKILPTGPNMCVPYPCLFLLLLLTFGQARM
jgi:hypothetical protein